MRPTMLYRNLMSMDVEESITANPLDGVVLLGGCDKTTPALLMGAASADIPAILVTGGPQLKGNWRGEELGSCTDCRRYQQELRAERITEEDWAELQNCIVRSPGHCMVMGTASTMAAMGEASAWPYRAMPPFQRWIRGASNWPKRPGGRSSSWSNRGYVPRPFSRWMPLRTPSARCMPLAAPRMPLYISLPSPAVGLELPLRLFDALSRTTPFILNLKPSGTFLMEDFYYAGGVPALLTEIAPLLHLDALTVMGQSLGATLPACGRITTRSSRASMPSRPEGGLAVLYGSQPQMEPLSNPLRHRRGS